jgi:anti-sigma factor RsiW
MNCQGYLQSIHAYCEGELPPAERRELEGHAATCPACREFHAKALEITCREVAELYEYVAGSLPPEKRRLYERHFSICEACRNYLETYRQTLRLARESAGSAGTEAPPPLGEDLVRAILEARRREP